MRSFPLSSAAWRFRDASQGSPWRVAVVPGCVHRDLRRLDLIPDPFWSDHEAGLQWIEERDWEYRATFTVPAALLVEEVVDLVADGLDTVATVSVNGHEVARTENMFRGYRWDVKPRLRPGKNELRVRFESAMSYIRRTRPEHAPREINDPVGRCVVIRKQQCQFGWDWGPRFVTAGIWQDIRLEAWSGNRLESVRVTQQHGTDGSVVLQLAPEFARGLGTGEVELRWKIQLESDGGAAGSGAPGQRSGGGAAGCGDPALQRSEREAAGCGDPALQRSEREAAGSGDPALQWSGRGSEIVIDQPQLWWPNGQGAQPLYALAVEAVDAEGRSLGCWTQRIGLRTIVLDRHKDEWGESFQFLVNGRAIFAKGANWIPAHSFVAGLTRADYARDLQAAAQANMNMIRVWGGGIYESEEFFDWCDELGLLVWQDFMFACTLYPADGAFLESAREEVRDQARRLRHRASLALWCGNNEVFGCNVNDLVTDKLRYAEYELLFHKAIPEALRPVDDVTPYWPSSPWRGDTAADHAAGVARGDTHFWDVWHARQPVKDYEKYVFRFVSEFGMQSYSSPETNATFCPPHADNVFGPEMENHQKNRFGNQIILDYVSRLYRFPQGEDALIYLAQLNQAYCMQVGVEHWRRSAPRCMGALFWQLNDCWPVASWSSIEFTGRWRALHHAARRFFAPALVTAQVPGDEMTIIGNYRRSSVHEVHLYTVYDAPEPAEGVLRWDVFHLDGRVLQRGRKAVVLRYGESVRQQVLDLAKPVAKFGRGSIYVRMALDMVDVGRGLRTPPSDARLEDSRRGAETPPYNDKLTCVSEDTVFLTAPRFLELPKAKTRVAVRLISPTSAEIAFTSTVFQHRFAFDLPGLKHQGSDNFFDLYPGETKTVTVRFSDKATAAQLKRRLTCRSLVDTY